MLESGCVLAKIKLRDARHHIVTCVMILMYRLVTNTYVNVCWVICYVFFIFGGLFTMWGPFCYFLLHDGGLFWACPPPPPHDCKEGSRAFSRERFLCDRNLMSSGHVLLRFCLKNIKK